MEKIQDGVDSALKVGKITPYLMKRMFLVLLWGWGGKGVVNRGGQYMLA